jgi:lipopolysaccharide/colanic/teichoic acid biosynthesis glycosyltransferase
MNFAWGVINMSDVTHAKSRSNDKSQLTEYERQSVATPRVTKPRSLQSFDSSVKKRIFDATITALAAPLWLPVVIICALLILILDGRPIFYVSQRQVAAGKYRPIFKFRTMKRDADKILNRDTVPVTGTAFLNIPRGSDIYTPIGRMIERLALTELPQLFHVLSGTMSLVGSRPLPARVVEVLRANYSDTDARFLTTAGLTGPVQLVGRESISDADRLRLEIQYGQIASSAEYSMWLDLGLLLYTVIVVLVPDRLLTVAQAGDLMRRLKRSA